MYVCVDRHRWACVELSEHLAGVDSLLPQCGSQGVKLRSSAWPHAPLPAVPFHWPEAYNSRTLITYYCLFFLKIETQVISSDP